MNISVGMRVRVHGTDEGGNARSASTGKPLARSFTMDVTSNIRGDIEGVEVTGKGRMRMSGGMVVSRRVILGDGDHTIIDAVEPITAEVAPVEVTQPKPTLAQLAQTAAEAHYANACSEDPEISSYNSPTYLGSSLALLRAIAAAYPDVSAARVVNVFVDGGDRISGCVRQVRDDMVFEIEEGNRSRIDDLAYAFLVASPIQGPTRLVTEFVLHCEGGVYVDRTLATASWWDRYELTPGMCPLIPTNIGGIPCKPGEKPYYYIGEIDAILRESYRVNRLFHESSTETTFPDFAKTVYVRLYAHEVTDGRVLASYGTYTRVRQFTKKAGV